MVKTNKKRAMVKLNKSRHSHPPTSKSPQENNVMDVMNTARRKLKGALQDLMPHSDDESSSDDDNRHHWNSAAIKRARRDLGGSSKQRQSIGASEKSVGGGTAAGGEGFKNSFIMKLFDRTVDLSNYTESTPLYPICRAWIANSSLYHFTRKCDELKDDMKNNLDDSSEITNERKTGDILKLPSPTHRMDGDDKMRVPEPVPYHTNYPHLPRGDGGDDQETGDQSDEPTRDELLADNLAHWTKVRNSWKQASKLNEQRYSTSINILTDMFYNCQKTL